jgi:hypothetical protein
MGKRVTEKRLTSIGLATIPTTGAYGDVSAAVAEITWKGGLNLTAHEAGMGQDAISAITTAVQASTVTIKTTKDNRAVKTLKAYLQGVTPATFVAWNTAAQKDALIWGNEKDSASGKIYRSFFVLGAKFDGDGNGVAAGGSDRTLSGQALLAMEFESAIQVDRIAGNATPVTALAPTKTTMIAWPAQDGNRYALAVLKLDASGNITLLDKALGDYTETATTITLAVGLGTNEAALICYLYTDS